MRLLDSESFNDGSIANEALIASHMLTGDACIVVQARLGDSTKGIAGNGVYELNVYIARGSNEGPVRKLRPLAASGETIIFAEPQPFVGISGDTIKVKATGLSSDSDVNAETKIFAVDLMNAMNVAMPASKAASSVLEELHLAKAALVNKKTHAVATGVDELFDDDGSTKLATLTPSEADGIITRMPS